MKKIDSDQMCFLNGGSWALFVEDASCIGLSAIVGVINPLAGLVFGLGCSLYYNNKLG